MANDFPAWLEESPDILYRALLPGGTNPFLDYWRSQYGRVYNDYLGGLGRTAIAGQVPNQTFADYLNTYGFNNQWQSLSPGQRGEAMRPVTKWNIPW